MTGSRSSVGAEAARRRVVAAIVTAWFVVFLASLVFVAPVAAQESRFLTRSGFLAAADSGSAPPEFRRGMHASGYVESENAVVDVRAGGDVEGAFALRIARALGPTIPAPLLLRADEAIGK